MHRGIIWTSFRNFLKPFSSWKSGFFHRKGPKRVKEWREVTFMKEWLEPLCIGSLNAMTKKGQKGQNVNYFFLRFTINNRKNLFKSIEQSTTINWTIDHTARRFPLCISDPGIHHKKSRKSHKRGWVGGHMTHSPKFPTICIVLGNIYGKYSKSCFCFYQRENIVWHDPVRRENT